MRLLIAKGAQLDGRTPDGLSYIEAAESEDIKSLLAAWIANCPQKDLSLLGHFATLNLDDP